MWQRSKLSSVPLDGMNRKGTISPKLIILVCRSRRR
jgi:hypothetical protein